MNAISAWWEYRLSNSSYRLWNLPFMPVVPYPLRAARLSLDLNLLGCWWFPRVRVFPTLTEQAKAEGSTIWYARWLFFQVSYSRFL